MESFNSLKISGDENLKNGKFEDAITKYSLLLEMECENKHLIYLNRCLAYLQLEKYDEALFDAKQSIVLKSDYAKAWGRLGSCLLARNENNDSKIAFAKAFELNPTNDEYKRLSEMEYEEDEEMNNIMSKIKNLTFLNKINQENTEETRAKLPSEAISEIENMLPLNGVMGNIFNKMLGNKNLLDLIQNENFQKKIINFKNNPLDAIKDPEIMYIMKDIMNDINVPK